MGRSWLLPASLGAAMALHLLLALGAWVGGALAWGANFARYLPNAFRWIVLVLPFLFVPAALLWEPSRAAGGKPWGERAPRGRKGNARRAALEIGLPVLLLAPLFWIFRDRTHLLGDGRLILVGTLQGKTISDTAPLADRIAVWIAGFHPGPLTSVDRAAVEHDLGLLAVAAGIVFVLASALLWRRVASGGGWFVVGALAVFLLQPYLLLFFGYVEFYPPAAAAALVVALTALLALAGRLPPFLPAALWVVGLGMHSLLLLLAPLVVAPFLGASRRRALVQGGAGLVAGAALLAAAGAVPVTFAERLVGRGEKGTLLHLAVTDRMTEAYGLFDPAHLLDFANAILLAAPLLLLVPIWVAGTSVRGRGTDPAFRALAVTACASLAASFLLNPQLGMARDWDLMALALLPANLFAVYVLFARVGTSARASGERSVRLFAALVLFLAGMGAGRTAAWVAVQRDPGAAVARGRAIASEGALNSAFARSHFHRDLFLVLNEEGKNDEALEEAQAAYALRPRHPELAYNVATVAARLAKYELARGFFLRAVELDPGYTDAYVGLGVVQLYLGDRKAAESSFRRAAELDPRDLVSRANLVRFYTEEGDLDRAVAMAREMRGRPLDARKASPLALLAGKLEAAGRAREAAEVRALLPAGR